MSKYIVSADELTRKARVPSSCAKSNDPPELSHSVTKRYRGRRYPEKERPRQPQQDVGSNPTNKTFRFLEPVQRPTRSLEINKVEILGSLRQHLKFSKFQNVKSGSLSKRKEQRA